jgi:hypothetical protein
LIHSNFLLICKAKRYPLLWHIMQGMAREKDKEVAEVEEILK